MAIISTHTLNSVDGSHAAGVKIAIFQITTSGERVALHLGETDEGGRFVFELQDEEVDVRADHEMVLQLADYFKAACAPATQNSSQLSRPLKEVVIRFQMAEPGGRYHMPFMLAPHSYSVWASS